jgi:hypothetical protein
MFLRDSLICEMKSCINVTNISYVCNRDLFPFTLQAVDTPRIKYPKKYIFSRKINICGRAFLIAFTATDTKTFHFILRRLAIPCIFPFPEKNFENFRQL